MVAQSLARAEMGLNKCRAEQLTGHTVKISARNEVLVHLKPWRQFPSLQRERKNWCGPVRILITSAKEVMATDRAVVKPF